MYHVDIIVAVLGTLLLFTNDTERDKNHLQRQEGQECNARNSKNKGCRSKYSTSTVLHSCPAWHVPYENFRRLQSRCICLLSVLFLLNYRSGVRNFVAEQLQLVSKFALPSLRWRHTQNPPASEQHTNPHMAANAGTKIAPMLHRQGPWSSSTITGWLRLVC